MHSVHEGFLGGAPALRVRAANDKAVNPAGRFVLYWMIATRRASSNFALDRAVAWCRELGLPLVVLEALRVDYPWASDRLHRFVIDGMADNVRAFSASGALYYPYVEPGKGAGKGLLARLSEDAALIVTDDYPCFFLPQAVAAAATRVAIRLEAVDSNGLLPLAAVPQAYPPLCISVGSCRVRCACTWQQRPRGIHSAMVCFRRLCRYPKMSPCNGRPHRPRCSVAIRPLSQRFRSITACRWWG